MRLNELGPMWSPSREPAQPSGGRSATKGRVRRGVPRPRACGGAGRRERRSLGGRATDRMGAALVSREWPNVTYVLEALGVGRRYPGGVLALSDVTVQVSGGETLVLIG